MPSSLRLKHSTLRRATFPHIFSSWPGQLIGHPDQQAGSYFPLTLDKIYLGCCNSEWQISLHSHDTFWYPPTLLHLVRSGAQMLSASVAAAGVQLLLCIVIDKTIFSLTSGICISTLRHSLPHGRTMWQKFTRKQWKWTTVQCLTWGILLLKACLHSAGVWKEEKQHRSGKSLWGITNLHTFGKSYLLGEAYHCTIWLGLHMHSYRSWSQCRDIISTLKTGISNHIIHLRENHLPSPVLLLLLAQCLTTVFQSLGLCFVCIFFILFRAQKE